MKPGNDIFTPTPISWRIILFQFAVGIPVLLTIPVVAAGVTAVLASPLAAIPVNSTVLRWILRGCAVPVLYTVWLLMVLSMCAVDVQSRRWYRGLKKVPRVCSAEGVTKYFPVLSLYLRMKFLYSLPLTTSLLMIPGIRWLVLWSYAPSAHLGFESYAIGLLYDPDLTTIGEGAIVGSGVSVVAHSLTTNPDGTKVLSTAPIVIGPRAVISGESLISLGVTIGADAIVEAMSYVEAFTQIPAGEVWGGVPAVFRRKRFETDLPSAVAGQISRASTSNQETLERDVTRTVATALRLPFDTVSPTLSSDECAAWDSLGQMAIASAVYSLLGVVIPTEKLFRLRSVPEIVEYLATSIDPPARVEDIVLPSNPELLSLLDHAWATRMLAQRASHSPPQLFLPVTRIVVAATFTADPLSSTLNLWSNAFGIPVEFESAGFDQVPQALLSPESPFRSNADGVNIILARPEDLLLADRGEQILDAVTQFAAEFPNLLLVTNLPPLVSSDCSGWREEVRRIRNDWEQALSGIEGIQVLDFAGIVERIGTVSAANAVGDRIARIPYSADVFAELGIAIARRVRSRRRAPAKVLALDADGVLWGNVLGEDGFNGIALGQEGAGRQYQSFQQSILRLKNRGVMLAVVSRNELTDVQRVFESHPGMILHWEDIAVWRVNWQPKSQNLKEIASELNLGLDSFVFVDDDVANQLEVQSALPEVTVVPLPSEPSQFAATIERLWCFDATSATSADANRTQMIQQEQERRELRNIATDLDAYLASLQLRVVMRPAARTDIVRVAQLTQKTNQFNLSLRRRSEAELSNLSTAYSIYVVEVSDRLGDYGLVGVCILLQPEDPAECLEIDSLIISCRALGRRVEEAILYGMTELVRKKGRSRLDAELVVGPRNQPIVHFLERAGFVQSGQGIYSLDVTTSGEPPRHITWIGPTSDQIPCGHESPGTAR